MSEEHDRIRLDKWLWAARFFKTRAMAATAIAGGRVYVGDVRAKASKAVHEGDTVRISKGQLTWTVVVRAVSDRRGAATQAAELYEETDESRVGREAAATERRVHAQTHPFAGGRPTKRDRRRIERLRGRKS